MPDTRTAPATNDREAVWCVLLTVPHEDAPADKTLDTLLSLRAVPRGGIFLVHAGESRVSVGRLPDGVVILSQNDCLPPHVSHVLVIAAGLGLRPDYLETHSRIHRNRPNSILFGRIVSTNDPAKLEVWEEWDRLVDPRDERVLAVGSRLDRLNWREEVMDLRHFSIPALKSGVPISHILSGRYARAFELNPVYGWASTTVTLAEGLSLPVNFRRGRAPREPTGVTSGGRLISATQPGQVGSITASHVNILVSSLGRGGAERIVADLVCGLGRVGATVNLFVMYDREPSFPVPVTPKTRVVRLDSLGRRQKITRTAIEVLGSPNQTVFTHLIRSADLAGLWERGILTCPVIHNSPPGWQDAPTAYPPERVPFLVACCDSVANDLVSAGSPVPVVTVRHELPLTDEDFPDHEDVEAPRIDPTGKALVIGMVGEFKRQKAYARAAEILARVWRVRPAKLVVLGGRQMNGEDGRRSYEEFQRKVEELSLQDEVILPGSVWPVEPWLRSFDVFLNCSDYEGYSIATLEALRAGRRAVLSRVGGQEEVRGERVTFIEDAQDVDAYVSAILEGPNGGRPTPPPESGPYPDLVPALWSLLSDVSAKDLPRENSDGVLFVINNLGRGGAQRSLTNLLTSSYVTMRGGVCIRRGGHSTTLTGRLIGHGVPVWSTTSGLTTPDQAREVLALAERFRARTICFWNCDAKLKLLLAKVLDKSNVRLVDVSPGSKYFEELRQADDFGRRISFDQRQYAERLDAFVYKYSAGGPTEDLPVRHGRAHLIPNGIPRFVESADNSAPARQWEAAPFTVGTCCRLDPVKRVHWLLEVMALVNERAAGLRLVIVGGPSEGSHHYWDELKALASRLRLDNVTFAGTSDDVFAHLRQFHAFVMVSEPDGCPNASLEAMATGLPVIATASASVGDQITEGENGFIVDPGDPREMAERILRLCRDRALAQSMGARAAEIARTVFGMHKMVRAYERVLSG